MWISGRFPAWVALARGAQMASKTPPREIPLRRLARAQALRITHPAYALEIMERGIYL
ncbi:MAG: hypothetical protein JO122_01840 [Acetobacteraceae bacterium]|nr:hypothetical protein [Acetobacteraceae bacterium]